MIRRIFSKLFLVELTFIFFCPSLWAIDLSMFCEKNKYLSSEEFLKSFPYEELGKCSYFESIPLILENCRILVQAGRQGIVSVIFSRACEVYIDSCSLYLQNPNTLLRRFEVGEALITNATSQDSILKVVLNGLGHQILFSLASLVQRGLDNDSLDANDERVISLQKKLEKYDYLIQSPVSNWDKVLYHGEEGNWGYIWDRFRVRYLERIILVISLALNSFFVSKLVVKIYKQKLLKNRCT